jgi:hypothetical protein
MGYDTDFYGRLNFTRRLTREELDEVDRILRAGQYDEDQPEIEEVIQREAERERVKRGGGPLVFVGSANAITRAQLRGCVVGPELSSANAAALRITDDGKGLEYCAEKSDEMVEAVNFIIANARRKIPDFGLKGSLFADTEFEPYHWLLKINSDGWAEQAPCRMTSLMHHNPRAYMRHLRWNWRRPSAW